MFLSRLVTALLALCLGLPSHAHAGLAGPCPSAESAATDGRNLGACLDDADAARARGDFYAAGAAHRAAVNHARRAYDNGRKDPAFVKVDGSNLVYFVTEHCDRAKELEPTARSELLGACIELLQLHVGDLKKISTAGEQTESALKILTALLALRDSFIPPPANGDLTEKQGPPAATPLMTTGSKPPPAVSPITRGTVVPPGPAVDPVHRRVPRGLYAGLGISVSASAASAVLLGVSAAVGQAAKKSILADMTDCGAETTPTCSRHSTAMDTYIAGSVLLGVSLAATVLFTGLIIRHRRHHVNKAVLTINPLRSGMTGGLVLRF